MTTKSQQRKYFLVTCKGYCNVHIAKAKGLNVKAETE